MLKKTNHYEPEKINGSFNDKYIEYKSEGNENTSTNQYIEKIRAYLGNMINCPGESGEWKVHLTMNINFMSLKDSGVSQPMQSKCDNIEIIIGDDKLLMSFLVHFLLDIKWFRKHQ